jgi:hypothetical protein
MASGYIDLPVQGVASWKTPVNTVTSLPSLGNTLGDARATEDTGLVYVWTGAAWVTGSGGGGGGANTALSNLANVALNTTLQSYGSLCLTVL